MRVEDVLHTKGAVVITVHEDTPLTAAIEIMHRKQIGALVVLDARSRVCGMLTERHILRTVAENLERVPRLHVMDVMSRHVIYCSPDDSVTKAAAEMTAHKIRHLPVMRDNTLVGIISMGDLVHHRLREAETEASVLREIVLARH